MATQTSPITSEVLPEGTWTVDPGASAVAFEATGMWGLAKVRGIFSSYRGTLTAGPRAVGGELAIDAASLDTENAKRDAHLRSADFFDVERHPEIVFITSSMQQGDEGLTVSGDLRVGAYTTRLDIPVDVERFGDDLRLQATTSVVRESVGLGWNKLGMIRGDAQLTLDLTLTRQ
jgi:polyisoprenoid-binding protein YceI